MTVLIGPEALLTSIALLIALLVKHHKPVRMRSLNAAFANLARRRNLGVLVCFFTSLALRAALLPLMPIPDPAVQDEFSYLLAADTFAHGRLTNPTPPMWTHFEQFHVIYEPTYASKYPPMQGVILAAGRMIGGLPFLGVWLSTAMLCAGICWMMQGWLPPQWALFGGMLAALRLSTSYWDNSYWGGAAAGIGGVLVAGALPRIVRRQRIRDAVLLAVGLGILANSRPYEGLIFALPAVLWLFIWTFIGNLPVRTVATRIAFPMFFVLALLGGAMGYYFWRVTGNPLRMPYQVYQSHYAIAPSFLWENPYGTPAYRHSVIAKYFEKAEMPVYVAARTLPGFARACGIKLLKIWAFYIGPALTIPLIMIARAARDRRVRPLVIIAAVAVAGSLFTTMFFPHYLAPLTGVIFALIAQSMRHLKFAQWDDQPIGKLLVRGIVVICVLMVPIQAATILINTRRGDRPPGDPRAKALLQLSQLPGPQLAIVRYRPDHRPLGNEWVDNDADIDHSKVVWARDMGPEKNRELVEYYHKRQVWLVEPDETPPRISPYR